MSRRNRWRYVTLGLILTAVPACQLDPWILAMPENR